MQICRLIAVSMLLLALAGCAGANGTVQGSAQGGTAHTAIFRLPFPP